MITLPSRHYPSPEDFEQDFYDSITPGIIPRRNFVEWHTIEKKTRGLISCVEFYSSLRERLSGGLTREEEFIQELADSLLACDNPMGYLECAFEMLAHTDRELVTCEDDISLVNLAQAIQAGDESTAIEFSQLLFDLGFLRILRRNDLDDVLFGVQVGLESHRRKNIGGRYFKDRIRDLLQRIVEDLGSLVDQPVKLLEEVKIPYGQGLSKRVDFAINIGGRNRFGLEVNFYTVSGSKPTEIKRAYSDLRRQLSQAGVELIWITDGKGYRSMRRSLRDAYSVFPNIYNLRQAEAHLQDDLMAMVC